MLFKKNTVVSQYNGTHLNNIFFQMPQYLETGIRIISMPKVTEFEKVTVKGQNIEYFLIFQPRIHW